MAVFYISGVLEIGFFIIIIRVGDGNLLFFYYMNDGKLAVFILGMVGKLAVHIF